MADDRPAGWGSVERIHARFIGAFQPATDRAAVDGGCRGCSRGVGVPGTLGLKPSLAGAFSGDELRTLKRGPASSDRSKLFG